jgi:hypothetical protein
MDSFVSGSSDARWEAEFRVLRAAMDDIEDRVSDAGFEFDDFSFSSEAELRNFVIEKKVPSAGQCWDLFSVLVVMKPKKLTGKEGAGNRFSAERVSTSTLENDLAASMSHDQPGLLFGLEGGSTAAADEGFAACRSYSKWIGKGCKSYKLKLGKLLKNYSAGVRGLLAPGSVGRGSTLVRTLLSALQDQWSTLVAFMGTFVQELVEVSKFTPSKAYLLVGRCVRAVFETMVPYRAEVSLLTDPGALDEKVSFIWAVLQCHRIMQQFLAVAFRGHPSIVKELGLFTLTERVDPSEMEALAERADAVEKMAKKAIKDLDNFEKKSRSFLGITKTLLIRSLYSRRSDALARDAPELPRW